MRIGRASALLLWAAIAGPVGSLGQAGSPAEAREDSVVRGEVLFQAHCAACHGVDGRGDGPAAGDLRTGPGDLTRLRRVDDAAFPAERLHQVIDGRLELDGHGSREMPIWGLTFRERSRDDDQEAEAAAAIDDLVAYLRSIQGAVPAPE